MTTGRPAAGFLLLGQSKIKACAATGCWSCMCAGIEPSSQGLLSAAPQKSFLFLARYPSGVPGSLDDPSSLCPGFGHPATGPGTATPVPALLTDSEHPPRPCWQLLSSVLCSLPPVSCARPAGSGHAGLQPYTPIAEQG